MNRKSLFTLLAIVMVFSMVLAACSPQPAATPAPTTAPTEPPAPAFSPIKAEAPNCDYGGEFKTIEAVDQNTVKFTLCTPDPAFPSKVAFSTFAIQDQEYLNANGGSSAKMSEQPNGTGPYKVKEWVRGDHITLEANPDYWGPAPKMKTVIFRWSKEASQRLLELQSGTVDGIDNPAPEDVAKIQSDPNLQLIPRQAGTIFYLGMNNTIKPFDNEKVRQALAMAIDKKRIVDNFYQAGSTVAEQFVPPIITPGFSTAGDGATWYAYDPAKAKQLLAEAGYPDGFETTLAFRNVVRPYVSNQPQIAQDLQAQLAEIGVKVKIVEEESGAFLQSVADGKEPLFMLGWTMDYPDATNFYDFHFTGASKNFGDPYPDLVAKIKEAATITDPVARQKVYDEVNTLVKQHIPMIPIAHGGSATAWKKTVEGAHSSPLGNEYMAVVSVPNQDQLVWMQNAEPIMLWCADETDGESLRACEQVYESLLSFKVGGTEVEPGLAEKYTANADLTEWTFNLRPGVKFQNGATLDANDVVATYRALWDYNDPNHTGNTKVFEYFGGLFGKMLNAPPPSQ